MPLTSSRDAPESTTGRATGVKRSKRIGLGFSEVYGELLNLLNVQLGNDLIRKSDIAAIAPAPAPSEGGSR